MLKLSIILDFLRKRKFLTLIIIGVIILIWIFFFRNNAEEIKTASVKRQDIKNVLTLTGEIDSASKAELVFQSSGNLAVVNAKEGDSIKKGQLIAKLDTTLLSADLQRARSDLRSAEASLDKVLDSLKGLGTGESFTEREERTTTEVNKDKAFEAVIKAQKALNDASLISPIDGTLVFASPTTSGVNVSPSSAKYTIADTKNLIFKAKADQGEIINLSEEKEAQITLDSLPQVSMTGKISKISLTPNLGDSSVVYNIEITISDINPDFQNKIRLGMTGDVQFILDSEQNTLALPTGFIKIDDNGEYIKSSPNDDSKIYIKTGIVGDDITQILSGLEEGQTIYE